MARVSRMKTRVFRLWIRNSEQGLGRFAASHRTPPDDRRRRSRATQGYISTTLDDAWNLITDERVRVLRTIKQEEPAGLPDLAQLLRREEEGVRGDVNALIRVGLIALGRGRPRVVHDEIRMSIPL